MLKPSCYPRFIPNRPTTHRILRCSFWLDVSWIPNPLSMLSDVTVAKPIYNDKFDFGNYLSW